jgi:hypothetical protein
MYFVIFFILEKISKFHRNAYLWGKIKVDPHLFFTLYEDLLVILLRVYKHLSGLKVLIRRPDVYIPGKDNRIFIAVLGIRMQIQKVKNDATKKYRFFKCWMFSFKG